MSLFVTVLDFVSSSMEILLETQTLNGLLKHANDIKHNFLDAKLFKIAKMPVSVVRTATFLSFMPGKYDSQLFF